MSLKERYPTVLDGFDVESRRYLVVVDKNYDDVDSDEFDVFDPSEYSHIVYITERLQSKLGEKGVETLIRSLEDATEFEAFYAHEKDSYGVMSALDEEQIADVILTHAEEILS